MTMSDVRRASEALRLAAGGGHQAGALTPAVFGCPFGHTARLVSSPLPLGRCGRCGAQLAVLGATERSRAA
jgi:hypothetical protein